MNWNWKHKSFWVETYKEKNTKYNVSKEIQDITSVSFFEFLSLDMEKLQHWIEEKCLHYDVCLAS